MDGTLEPLWKTGENPFNGETIYPLDDVFVRDAIAAIPCALDHIAQCYPTTQLFALDDWHEHDGFITPANPTTIEALREQISTPNSYVAHHSDDFAVYRAIYPESLKFLLRYCLFNAHDRDQAASDREVHCTFTGHGHDIAEMTKRWAPYNLEVASLAKYFRERYA